MLLMTFFTYLPVFGNKIVNYASEQGEQLNRKGQHGQLERFLWGAVAPINGKAWQDGKGLVWPMWLPGMLIITRDYRWCPAGRPNHEGIDFYHRYPEVLSYLYKWGSRALEHPCMDGFSQWGWAQPKAGLKFYDDLFDECLKYIQPVVTLSHFEMLSLGAEYGGWRNRKVWLSWTLLKRSSNGIVIKWSTDVFMKLIMANYHSQFALFTNSGLQIQLGEDAEKVMYQAV